mgnify:CR=1 FL=1
MQPHHSNFYGDFADKMWEINTWIGGILHRGYICKYSGFCYLSVQWLFARCLDVEGRPRNYKYVFGKIACQMIYQLDKKIQTALIGLAV